MDEGTSDTESTAERLREATSAARNAYRDTARLIRLLSVLSSPSPPAELLEKATAVISEVFTCDVVCVVQRVSDRYVVLSASGIPDDDDAFVLSARHIPGDVPDAALWRALASAAGGRLDDEGGSHWRLRLPYGSAPATSPDPA